LTQAAEALAEAHAVGLIHRDIKPGNIVLCEHTRRPDQVKVVDFGLVRQIGSSDPALSTTDAITGTPLYLAPEAITSPNDIDERADLYALGAVGYFLLTGQPVFSGSSVLQVLARALHEPIERPSVKSGRDTPADLERVILACLARDRNQRPKDAPSLKRDLASCEGIPPWTPDDARRWWQSKPQRKESRDPRHSSPFTATLAVAPRP
jgi:serine/threonine-protein kinase